MYNEVVLDKYGYYKLKEIPSDEEIKNYYANSYYQESLSQYEQQYSSIEIEHTFQKISSRKQIVNNLLGDKKDRNLKFLDIGSGEGWALRSFLDSSWEVLGLDYSDFGCKIHNPECLDYLKIGDIYESVDMLIEKEEKFDCLWLDNVLEHVVDPLALLKKCANLISDEDGVLVIDVPNDFSVIQKLVYENDLISNPFWVGSPDHISYFNRDGLIAVCDAAGWSHKFSMGDYPIDLNILNENTNYIKDKSKGKSCHNQRVAIENLLFKISIEKTNKLYEAMAELGLGRSVIGFFQLKSL